MDRRTAIRRVGGALALGGAAVLGYSGSGSSTPTVLVAGSLQSVADDVGDAAVEAHGSVAVRRLVDEGARDPDAMALADPRLFAGLATPRLFATNALVVAYDPDSPHADAIERDWQAALRRDLLVGRTDPANDPLGYRTVMALRLAGAADALDDVDLFPETRLLQSLEAGAIDAAFAYRNMAVEHDVPYASLPDRIDFSNPQFADRYASVSVELPDRTVRGAPIRYGAAALTDAGKPWIDRLVEGHDRLQAAGFGVPDGYPVRATVADAASTTD